MKIRIGTRKSKLALWQAHHVQHLLSNEGIKSEIVEIETKGDKILDVTISKIGSKGVFTQEIEEQLATGEIDIAVHSAKDMQSELPFGFEILAFTDREKANDVLVSHNKELQLTPDASFTIGTSSTRRVAILRHYFPHIKTVDIRGNLQTRIAKLEAGHCDALMLAYAGVHRMGYDDMISQMLPEDIFTPPVGQGSIAIEASKTMSGKKKVLIQQILNNEISSKCLLSERAFLRKLQGGCSIPSFANATITYHGLSISGGLVSLDGSQIIRHTVTGRSEDAEHLGQELASFILANGGRKILDDILNQQEKQERS
jgi:hydroxymethylbilane synthase